MPNPFNIFIGWSGDYTKAAAKALKNWLHLTLQATKPWMSEEDIHAGAKWLEEEDNALGLKFGILCLDPDNLKAPWLHYEAGALSKTLHAEKSRVCPYLLRGLTKEGVGLPLSSFQMKTADEAGTLDVLKSINQHVLPEPLPDDEVRTLFTERWPKLRAELDAIPRPSGAAPKKPTAEEMAAETLDLLRTLAPDIKLTGTESRKAQQSRAGQEALFAALRRNQVLTATGSPAATGTSLPGATLISAVNEDVLQNIAKFYGEAPPTQQQPQDTPAAPENPHRPTTEEKRRAILIRKGKPTGSAPKT